MTHHPNFVAAYLVDCHDVATPFYLLLKRSLRTYLPGIWQIVTGKVENMELAVYTVQREIREETSLSWEALYNVDVTMFYDQTKGSVAYSANFCAYVCKEAEVILSSEHDAYQWCTFKQAYELLAFPAQKETLSFIHKHFVSQKPHEANLIKC